MRMWLLNPKKMCRYHLLGEHVEMHMFVGAISKKKSIEGYIKLGLVDTDKIESRHDELAEEMKRRGYNHRSPLTYIDKINRQSVSIDHNEKELKHRCKECLK